MRASGTMEGLRPVGARATAGTCSAKMWRGWSSIGRRASRRISKISRPASSWHAVSLVPGPLCPPESCTEHCLSAECAPLASLRLPGSSCGSRLSDLSHHTGTHGASVGINCVIYRPVTHCHFHFHFHICHTHCIHLTSNECLTKMYLHFFHFH